ncbi:MAG: dodecin [Halofilum sp. (in: g-proteobacteria)]
MNDHVYKHIELTGSSPDGIEGAAVRNAIERASRSVNDMRWFEVRDTRGPIVDERIDHWQVTVVVGFTLDG